MIKDAGSIPAASTILLLISNLQVNNSLREQFYNKPTKLRSMRGEVHSWNLCGVALSFESLNRAPAVGVARRKPFVFHDNAVGCYPGVFADVSSIEHDR